MPTEPFFERAGLHFVVSDAPTYEQQRVREVHVTLEAGHRLRLAFRERVEEVDPGSGERSVTEREMHWAGRFLGVDAAGNGLVLLEATLIPEAGGGSPRPAPAPPEDRLRLAPSGGHFVQYAEVSSEVRPLSEAEAMRLSRRFYAMREGEDPDASEP